MFSLSEITLLFDLSRYLDRSLGSAKVSAKVKSKSEVAHCHLLFTSTTTQSTSRRRNTHCLIK